MPPLLVEAVSMPTLVALDEGAVERVEAWSRPGRRALPWDASRRVDPRKKARKRWLSDHGKIRGATVEAHNHDMGGGTLQLTL